MQGTEWQKVLLKKRRLIDVIEMQSPAVLNKILVEIQEEELEQNEFELHRLLSDFNVKTVNCPMLMQPMSCESV